MSKLKDPFKSAARFADVTSYDHVRVTSYLNEAVAIATNGHYLVGLFFPGKDPGNYTREGKLHETHNFPNWEQVMVPKKGCVYINNKKVIAACDHAVEQDKKTYEHDLAAWKTIKPTITGEAERRRHQGKKPFKCPRLTLHGGVDPRGMLLWGDVGDTAIERALDPMYLKKLVKLLGDPQTVTASKGPLTPVRFDSERGFAVLMPQRI